MAMTKIYFELDKRHGDMVDTLLNPTLVNGIGVYGFLSVFPTLCEHRYRFTGDIVNRLMYLCIESTNTPNDDKIASIHPDNTQYSQEK